MFRRPLVRWIIVVICLVALIAWCYLSIGTAQPLTNLNDPVVCRDKTAAR